MKQIKSIYGLFAATALMFSACNINEAPTFDDADAFVAFTSSTMSVGEEEGSLDIPVMLTSLSGLSTTIEFEISAEGTTATEGTDFSIEGEKSLTFDKEHPTQYIRMNVFDNDIFTGNKTVTLTLKESGEINLGASKTCKITIQDNEHPLLFILNTYKASADSYFSSRGSFDWEITIVRDEDDLSKVWVYNLDPYFYSMGYVAPSVNNYYGTVNADKTEIRVPVGQETGLSSGGNKIYLEGFSGADPDESEQLSAGESIVITILDNGNKLRIENAFGVASDGWYNLMYGGLEITKK